MRDWWHVALTAALGAGLVLAVRRCRRAEAETYRLRRLAALCPADLRPLVTAMDATALAIEDALPQLERGPAVRPADRPGPAHLRAVR